jgi:hypothetical protein
VPTRDCFSGQLQKAHLTHAFASLIQLIDIIALATFFNTNFW